MKKITMSLLAMLVAVSGMAQIKLGQDFNLKIYGQVRADIYYNSRDNVQSVDGLFYMYPKDEVLDPNGNDINSGDNSNMYTAYSRLGFDFTGRLGIGSGGQQTQQQAENHHRSHNACQDGDKKFSFFHGLLLHAVGFKGVV